MRVLLVALMAGFVFAPEELAQSRELEGGWWVVSQERYPPIPHPPLDADTFQLRISKGRFKSISCGEVVGEGVIKVTLGDMPHKLDLIWDGGKKVFKCIFKITNQRLYVCGPIDPQDARPRDFKVGRESKLVLYVFDRLKD